MLPEPKYLILIYMFLRVGFDLLSIQSESKNKFAIKDIGGIISVFIFFGIMFMLIQGGIFASKELLSDKVSFTPDYLVLPIYAIGYEFSRWFYFKKHPEYMSSRKVGIFLGNFVFSSCGILLLITTVFVILVVSRQN